MGIAASIALATEAESAEEPEAVAEPEPEAETPAPTKGRRRAAAKTAASAVTVNVVVARGMTRRVDAKLVRQVVERALQKNGWEEAASIDVLFVGDADMQEINATRRGIDEVTDVLAFPLLDLRPGQGLTQDFFLLPPDTMPHLGDVVISVDRFESQADEAGHSRQRELAFLTTHGVLHVLGYDHETDEERRNMRRREEDVLSELGLRRDGA
jgi:probable rRNA maturation factor